LSTKACAEAETEQTARPKYARARLEHFQLVGGANELLIDCRLGRRPSPGETQKEHPPLREVYDQIGS